jgi:hypothetical protein
MKQTHDIKPIHAQDDSWDVDRNENDSVDPTCSSVTNSKVNDIDTDDGGNCNSERVD